jgi:hypothetical protein
MRFVKLFDGSFVNADCIERIYIDASSPDLYIVMISLCNDGYRHMFEKRQTYEGAQQIIEEIVVQLCKTKN